MQRILCDNIIVEGGGTCPVGGVWSTGSAGAIGSHCGQVSAMRPNQEVCLPPPPGPGPRLHGRRSSIHLRPAAAGPGEEVAGPGEEQPRGDRGAGGPGEVRRGASSQNIDLGPVPPAREPLGGHPDRGGPPDSPLNGQTTAATSPEPADRCSGPAGEQAHPAT